MPDRDSIDERWSAHLSTLFFEVPLAERPAVASAAGFRTVEAWWPGPELDAWSAEVRRLSLRVACLNADGGDLARGERGFLNDPSRPEWVLDAVDAALDAATALDAGVINVLPGRRIGGVAARTEWSVAVEVLEECCRRAARSGTTLVVEHLNGRDVPDSFLPDAAAATRLIEEVGSERLRLLYDAYHAEMAGADPVREAPQLVAGIGHVQYSAVPDRGEPSDHGKGLGRFVAALREAGYCGHVGLELVPRESTQAALSALRQSLQDT